MKDIATELESWLASSSIQVRREAIWLLQKLDARGKTYYCSYCFMLNGTLDEIVPKISVARIAAVLIDEDEGVMAAAFEVVVTFVSIGMSLIDSLSRPSDHNSPPSRKASLVT